MAIDPGARAVAGLPPPVALLEREREVSALLAAAKAAAAGSARLMVVEGPAGIGKSRLLGALREEAPGLGLRVLHARGGELEEDFPFGVVRQLFEPALADPGVRERWLSDAAAPAAAVFSPPGDEPCADATFAALHGLYWLTASAAAEEPLLLCVDDLHWADRPSLRFVAYLARRLEGLPALVAVGLRTGEPGADPALLGEVAEDPGALVVRPGPLSDDATGALVEARLGAPPDPAFREACHRATGGNPLLLGQLLRSLGDDAIAPVAANAGLVREIGPSAISRTILLRLARLPDAAAAVARAVAVLGDGADLPGVATLAELPERDAADAIAALARAEILRGEPPLGFVHPLVRDAVYRDMTVGQREILHAAAARMLTGCGSAPERIAAHLVLMSPRGDRAAVATLREAAAAAAARGAPDSAAALLRRALEEPPAPDLRPRVLLELGLVESHVDAVAGTARLAEAYRTLPDVERRLDAARALAWGLIFTGDPNDGASVSREAAREAPPELDDLRRWLAAVELVSMHFGAEVPGGLERLAEERPTPPGGGPGARALQCLVALDWCLRGEDGREGPVALATGALEGGTVLSAPDAYTLGIGAMVTLELAESPASDAAWDRAMAAAHRNGSLFAISSMLMWRGWVQLRRGDLREARRLLEDGDAMLTRWGMPAEAWSTAFLAQRAVAAGDLAGARRILARPGGGREHSDGRLFRLIAETELRLAEGLPAEALAGARAVAERLERRGAGPNINPAWMPWRPLAARALDALGRSDEALDLLEADLRRARAWGAPGPVGRALRLMGELERQAGIPRLEEAVATLEASTARLELARALAGLGAAMRRARRPTEAREPLRRALEVATTCGAESLAVHARTELHATGARPRATALSGAAALTPSERRVAAMAAEGLSNRDIAQALYVTPKTVEVHLSSAYRKLGVRSRRELPEALATA